MTPAQAASKYHWVKYNSDTNTVELYLDNYMLSGSRVCEASFYLKHILQISPRYATTSTSLIAGQEVISTRRKPWFFDFGEYLHYCLEIFYEPFKLTKIPPQVDKWLQKCKDKWLEMKMDDYNLPTAFKADRTKYEDIGGWEGVAGLLIQYFSSFMDLRVRVVDTEISFGYGKEVEIGSFLHLTDYRDKKFINVECYLTGRIDLLVDNGYKIGPVDHKSTHKFDGNEHNDFNPHDGICGYILAINEILNKYRENGLTNLPRSSGGWIYHISNCVPSTPRDKSKKQGPRFKTTPVDKTQEQLEDYKTRQLSTFKRISELLFNDKTPEWNTNSCSNMFFRSCEYKPIHEQPSSEWKQIIENHYEVGKDVWDTREHTHKEKEVKE
jgi:hypothetical protein